MALRHIVEAFVGEREVESKVQSSNSSFSMASFGELLDALATQLGEGRQEPISAQDSARSVEIIRRITEALAWGERHESAFFDLFCERRQLPCLVDALCSAATPAEVRVQILQSLTILAQSTRRDTSFFYLLSGGHFSRLLAAPPDFLLEEEEACAYLASFIKGLALRLDEESAPVCLDMSAGSAEEHGFSLFSRAAHFAVHNESMVRTASRAAVLKLLRIEQPAVRTRAVILTQKLLLPNLVVVLRITWVLMNAAAGRQHTDVLHALIDTEEDLLGFLKDLLLLDICAVVEAVLQSFLSTALLPVLSVLEPPLHYPTHDMCDCSEEGKGQEHSAPSDMRINATLAAKLPRSSMVEPPLKRLNYLVQLKGGQQQEVLCEEVQLPTAAVAIRSAAMCISAFCAHRHAIETIAKVLLLPSLPCALVRAIHDSNDFETIDFAEISSNLEVADDAADPLVILIPNPFRAALLGVLGNRSCPASNDAALAAWLFHECLINLAAPVLEATGLIPVSHREPHGSTTSHDVVVLPEYLLGVLCQSSHLTREADYAIAGALADLTNRDEPWLQGVRVWVAAAAASALEKAGGLLVQAFRVIRSPGAEAPECTTSQGSAAKQIGTASMAAFQVFLDEASQKERQAQQSVQLRVNCSSALLLRQCVREEARGRDCAVARESRTFLLLWQLCAIVGAVMSQPLANPSKSDDDLGLERCLRELRSMRTGFLVEAPQHDGIGDAFEALGTELPTVGQVLPIPRSWSESASTVALPCAATLKTTGDVVCFPVSLFILHPSWVLLAERVSAVIRASAPVWCVRAAADPSKPSLLHLSLLSSMGTQPSAVTPMDVTLRFADEESCGQALQHLEARSSCEPQRLVSHLEQLVTGTVHSVQAQAWAPASAVAPAGVTVRGGPALGRQSCIDCRCLT